MNLPEGSSALERFDDEEDKSQSRSRSSRRPPLGDRLLYESESSDNETSLRRRKRQSVRGSRNMPSRRMLRASRSEQSLVSLSSGMDSDEEPTYKRRRLNARPHSERVAAKKSVNYFDAYVINDDNSSEEDRPRRAGRPRLVLRGPKQTSYDNDPNVRRSGRVISSKNMEEVGEDDIPEQVLTNGAAKFFGAKEQFQQLPSNDDFRLRHCQTCNTCNEYGNSSEKGRLVYCQACTFSYHQKCLGPRNSRDHLVTKIGDGDFVLQCRRCINSQKQKEPTAPDQSKCFICQSSSAASHPLRERKSTKEEHKEREENDGEDPTTIVLPDTINRAENVLFRCVECNRVAHFHHLPQRDGRFTLSDLSVEHLADDRFAQYCKTWTCKDCADIPAAVDTLIAWRPSQVERYQPGTVVDDMKEDDIEYLVKWKRISYFTVNWMSGAWVWGVTAPAMRKAFAKRDGNGLPKMMTEDAIPEENLRVDIVFDIEYTNVVNLHTVKVDQARVKEVKRALVKFKGLEYKDVVWVEPPAQEQTERWDDFRIAYDDWVMGMHIHPPPASGLSRTLSRLRAKDFGTTLKLQKQPDSLSGGELMDYQLEGVNWLYYQWFRKQNAILADEMGLGKTIQIIGFLATLTQLHNCYPFLIVVPNSTCPNWRREIKQWAPSLRVVSYYGSSEARRLAQKYELFPDDAKSLRCHIVVTSYDAAQDEQFRRVFRGVHWAGMIVDEGQRLKDDQNLLFTSLTALKIPFKVLLTGTPLQNNARELFNLLQFLDTSIRAKELEEEYAELSKDNVPKLHEMLRPFFLRRTKAGSLKFLPPIAQIIVPVSLTNVQKKLYRSILAKNPDLIRTIFGASKVKQTERASLNNILMQLRKCLCHPFVYNKAIEQIDSNPATAHRNLIDASSKLRLLEIMLPKLQERGHRVLIFSQFLDMLNIVEDFLDGLGLYYQRLDGTISSLQKQKRIDEFNAPDSQLFAFLLSTRAGGVGINLATADTVIILDPDFNPHQDIQALSRAHRIGQKKKVLVFQLTTRATAEEKIMQVGKKKMALDHVLIEQMDVEDDAGVDLESILRYGTDAIFKDDDPEDDIRYDSALVDKLLDRSQMEDTLPGKDNSAESQFSFARVWANDRGVLEEEGLDGGSDHEADLSIWDAILKEREREAAEEAAAKAEAFGRGRRKRQAIDYTSQVIEGDRETSPSRRRRTKLHHDESDTDFQADNIESEGDLEPDEEVMEHTTAMAASELDGGKSAPRPVPTPSNQSIPRQASQIAPATPNLGVYTANGKKQAQPHFKRAIVAPIVPSHVTADLVVPTNSNLCSACNRLHQKGRCPLKPAGVERCNLCGLAHYGNSNACAHFHSKTQLRAMIESLKQSTESEKEKELAKKVLVGNLGRLQRRRAEQAARANIQNVPPTPQFSNHPGMDGAFDRSAALYRAPNGSEKWLPYPYTQSSYPHAK